MGGCIHHLRHDRGVCHSKRVYAADLQPRVDNGIHVVHRMRTEDAEQLFNTSTMRAVLASGLTTVASFGNLAFSSHVGTASMIATLVVLPAWLKVSPPKRTAAA